MFFGSARSAARAPSAGSRVKSALARAATKTVWTSFVLGEEAPDLALPAVAVVAVPLASAASRPAVLNGQPERESEMPRQRLDWATTSSAARQCSAWLSPSSANVARARSGATPK